MNMRAYAPVIAIALAILVSGCVGHQAITETPTGSAIACTDIVKESTHEICEDVPFNYTEPECHDESYKYVVTSAECVKTRTEGDSDSRETCINNCNYVMDNNCFSRCNQFASATTCKVVMRNLDKKDGQFTVRLAFKTGNETRIINETNKVSGVEYYNMNNNIGVFSADATGARHDSWNYTVEAPSREVCGNVTKTLLKKSCRNVTENETVHSCGQQNPTHGNNLTTSSGADR